MAVKIRLARHGKKGYAFYHIVAADSRAPRDGRFIEKLGTYNPNTNPATIDLTSRKHWAGCRKAHNLRIPVGQFSRTRAYYTRSTCWAVSPRAHSRRPKPKLVSTNG